MKHKIFTFSFKYGILILIDSSAYVSVLTFLTYTIDSKDFKFSSNLPFIMTT